MTSDGALLARVRQAEWLRRAGRVRRVSGISVESTGPVVRLGEVCRIASNREAQLDAEVVAVSEGRVVLMPYQSTSGITVGESVEATGKMPTALVGVELLGRVVDGMGRPLDGKPLRYCAETRSLYPDPLNPLQRAPVNEVLETGVRAIDGVLTIGRGQRIGIFAGSGVGKSTLMGMLAAHVSADVMVVALIGERGREVQSFVQEVLSESARSNLIVVAATSDQPPLLRRRAAYLAHSIAEYFRDVGKHVCLLMDSVTRVAMAQREIGLASGELPTARGYTPSVFNELPRLLERPGALSRGGSITGIYTVLVDGDDFNEPISDTVRATLDGHIVLSRSIAQKGRYPAIDLTHSISRLATSLMSVAERKTVSSIVQAVAQYESSRDLIELGAYKTGTNSDLDIAIKIAQATERYFTQSPDQVTPRSKVLEELKRIAAEGMTGHRS